MELTEILKAIEKFWDARLGERYIVVYNEETKIFE